MFDWLDHVKAAAGCSHPIRLSGEVATIDRATGRLLASVSTADLQDGEIYKPCGNRHHAVCPSCARTYQRDAYQLVKAGVAGGKGIPATVAQHPAVFGTFTAPSFGPVHTQRTDRAGRRIPCRPRRHPQPCPHGVSMRCHRTHADDDRPRLMPAPVPLAFTGAKGAVLRRSNFQSACKWRDSVATAGLPGFHFHALWHTGNTLASRTGATLADLMARMGHASTRAALIYQHTARERDEHIADGLSSQIKQTKDRARSGHGQRKKR
ncbi:replication initiator [Micromonospora sp. SL4-19]|uniref:replication initiator n=1 Tax=Micromonospora sp. SL4-19 TaxID=3399129 RepID=UPI003A4DDBB2